MNGIHDMGGMHGFGELDIEVDEPVFREKWEGRVFAMSMFRPLGVPGGFRYMIEKIDPAQYLAYSYYEKWMHANIQGLLELGVVTQQELDEKMALFVESPTAMPPTATDARKVEQVINDIHNPMDIQPVQTNRMMFKVGQIVRAKNMHPIGHTRLPAYCRGKLGTIEKSYGDWRVDDTPPAGQNHAVETLYRVRFEGRELWGDEAEKNQVLYIDMFDSYLEPENAST